MDPAYDNDVVHDGVAGGRPRRRGEGSVVHRA